MSSGVMEAGVEVRRRRKRTDITVRDAAALRWAGEQWGARLDVLGVLLGMLGESGGPLALRTVRDVVARWERLGLARPVRMTSGAWVFLTRKGLDHAGLDMPVARVPWSKERHHHAVNVVRLAYEAVDRPGEWVSERLTWAERGREQSWHVPDGVIRVDDGTGCGWSEAVEVELSRKRLAEYRDDVFGNLRHGSHPVRSVRYFVAGERFRDRLTADLEDAAAGQGACWSVVLLPAVEGVPYIPGVHRG